MLKAYKYRLYPTKDQETLLQKSFGCVRWVYNWALKQKQEYYIKENKSVSIYQLDLRLKDLKLKEETKWLKEVNSQSLQQSLKNLDIAYTRFFKKQGKYPVFKSKKDKKSFSNPQNISASFENQRIYIPKFKNGIKCMFHRQFDGVIKNITVSQNKSGKYYVSILIDDEKYLPTKAVIEKDKTVGIDLGLKDLAILSDGTKFDNPRALKRHLKKIKKLHKKLSKKVKGSKNREKSRIKLAKEYEKVTNIRRDYLHKLTRTLIDNQNYTSYVLEDLSASNMMKNHKLAQAIQDVGWYSFKSMLEYKANWAGKNILTIGRFEPSSKTCSSCGYINQKLTLNDRNWKCICGQEHDRDINAAKNIKHFAFCKQNTSSKKEFLSREPRDFKPVENYKLIIEESIKSNSTKQEATAL
jgi:putative transposase